MSGPKAIVARLLDRRDRRVIEVEARLARVEQRLDDINHQLAHWADLMGAVNHGVADIQSKLGDASADVEMAAAMLMAADRRSGRADAAGT